MRPLARAQVLNWPGQRLAANVLVAGLTGRRSRVVSIASANALSTSVPSASSRGLPCEDWVGVADEQADLDKG
jgi:hypothetical protein